MADLTISYDPITIDNTPSSVTIAGLDNIKETLTLATPQALKTDSKSEFIFSKPIENDIKLELSTPKPLETSSSIDLDIKPLQFDQCLTIRLDPLPPTCIRQPYQQHFGLTLFGIEVIGFNLEGENQTILTDLPKQSHVVWGDVEARSQVPTAHPTTTPPATIQPTTEGPLRIRLGK